MRTANTEGMKAIEAAPGSIAGLGAAAFTSAAVAAPTPTIIITTATKAADAYLPVPAIVANTLHTPAAARRSWKVQNLSRALAKQISDRPPQI